MSKLTLTHTLPCGSVETRTTARAYTHVVIGRRDRNKDRALAAKIAKTDLDNFAYYQRLVRGGVGSKTGDYAWEQPLSQRAYDDALKQVDGLSSAEEYAQRRADIRVAAVGDGDFGPWQVLQWSGSLALATKAIGQWRDRYGFADVQAVAVIPGEAPAKAKRAAKAKG